jgi:N-methylhydantoinase A
MAYRVGVDIGGTFIDFCVFDTETRDLSTLKVLTTPAEPGSEVMEGMKRLDETYGIEAGLVESFIHGTTVGVNTVIQRKGATMALFTTENFTDVLEVARLRMPESYSLFSTRPEPLITRDRVFGITERLRADGSVRTPLDEASVIDAIARAKARGAEGIIISLLHSFRKRQRPRSSAARPQSCSSSPPLRSGQSSASMSAPRPRSSTAISIRASPVTSPNYRKHCARAECPRHR